MCLLQRFNKGGCNYAVIAIYAVVLILSYVFSGGVSQCFIPEVAFFVIYH